MFWSPTWLNWAISPYIFKTVLLYQICTFRTIQSRREQSRTWGMCRWGLTGLEGWKDDDDENNGIGSAGWVVCSSRLKFVSRSYWKASAKSFWSSDCESGFSLAFLPSTSIIHVHSWPIWYKSSQLSRTRKSELEP